MRRRLNGVNRAYVLTINQPSKKTFQSSNKTLQYVFAIEPVAR